MPDTGEVLRERDQQAYEGEVLEVLSTARNAVEEINAEIARLERQRDEMLERVEEIEQKVAALDERRITLAPSAFTGDVEADRELRSLEEEASGLLRRAKLARNAAKEFGRLIEEAKARRSEERRRLARERFEELKTERYALGIEAEEAMSELLGKLERYRSIHDEMVACARGFSDDEAPPDPPETLLKGWLTRRLERYLGLSSPDHYDRPLAEVDLLAAKPDEG